MKTLDPRIAHAGAVVAAGALVIVSWQRGYQPAVNAYLRDRAAMVKVTERTAQLDALVVTAGGKDAWLARNQRRLERLRARFPQQAQMPQLLNALVDAMNAAEVKLLDITQGNLEPAGGAEEPLRIEGSLCYRLPVTVTAEGRYHALRAAAERLTDEAFPGVVTVDQVDLHPQEAAEAKLEATFRLYLYVIGTPQNNSPHT